MTKSTNNKSCKMWCDIWPRLEERIGELGGRRGNRRPGSTVLRVVFECKYGEREVREFVLDDTWHPEFIQARISDHLYYLDWAMSYRLQIVYCA